MDLTVVVGAPCAEERLFEWVGDLGAYPRWLDLVARADPEEEGAPDGPAWRVDLRGRLGPLTRSKRLRMVRTLYRPPEAVRFERAEQDDRTHSPWVLEAEVAPTAEGSRLTMGLHYGGGLFGPVLERVLTEEVERGRRRLLAELSGG